jgi:hypothetical protein
MTPFRFKCEDCLIVFDLCPAPPGEWLEPMPDDTDVGPPTCLDRCPFCGSIDVKMSHDLPLIVANP